MMAYDMNVVKKAYDTAILNNASDKVVLALFEAGIVESGFRNIKYGDRDSIGFLQQRPSQGWGTVEQIMDVEYATKQFLNKAIPLENKYSTAGKLAQAVQRSAFPLKYDLKENEAKNLIKQISGKEVIIKNEIDNISITEFIKNPELYIEKIFVKFVSLITSLSIYTFIIIIIFISIGFVYAQDEIKAGIKAGTKAATGGII
jgi:hypothetical protein